MRKDRQELAVGQQVTGEIAGDLGGARSLGLEGRDMTEAEDEHQ